MAMSSDSEDSYSSNSVHGLKKNCKVQSFTPSTPPPTSVNYRTAKRRKGIPHRAPMVGLIIEYQIVGIFRLLATMPLGIKIPQYTKASVSTSFHQNPILELSQGRYLEVSPSGFLFFFLQWFLAFCIYSKVQQNWKRLKKQK